MIKIMEVKDMFTPSGSASSPWFKEVIYCDREGRKLLEIIERIQTADAELNKAWEDLRELLEEE